MCRWHGFGSGTFMPTPPRPPVPLDLRRVGLWSDCGKLAELGFEDAVQFGFAFNGLAKIPADLQMDRLGAACRGCAKCLPQQIWQTFGNVDLGA